MDNMSSLAHTRNLVNTCMHITLREYSPTPIMAWQENKVAFEEVSPTQLSERAPTM